MKILDVAEFYSERGGGVRAYLTQLSREGTRRGHAVAVLAPGPRDEESHEGSGRLVRLRGPSLPYDPTYHLLWNVRAVARAIAREQPDVLEASSPYVAAWVATRTRGVALRSLVLHSDFIDTYARPVLRRVLGEGAADRTLSPAWAWLRRLCSRVDLTVVSGAWLAAKLRARGIPRVECVPFGIYREALGPQRRDPELRKSLLGPLAALSQARLLVVAGRLAVEKRVSTVLQALETLRRDLPLGALVLGDGPERTKLQQRFPWARFEGFVTHRERYGALLASADALVHGCPHETFGFVVGEALASGVPVVVPAQGGAAEFATPGCAERYAPDGGVVACAVATRRLLDRPPEALSREALRAAATIPSSDEHFTNLFAMYARHLDARRAP